VSKKAAVSVFLAIAIFIAAAQCYAAEAWYAFAVCGFIGAMFLRVSADVWNDHDN
jgi:uncharacterized membrane protein YjdF